MMKSIKNSDDGSHSPLHVHRRSSAQSDILEQTAVGGDHLPSKHMSKVNLNV